MWDEVDKMKAENKKLGEETIPALSAKVQNLEKSVHNALIEKRIRTLFKGMEKDKAVSFCD